jgi:hypothetical protein
MSRTQRLTDETETRSRLAITFIDAPSSLRRRRASSRSTVFMFDNVPEAADGQAGGGNRTRANGTWKDPALPLSYARV